jgi:uncharacterized protein YggE
MRPTIVVRGEAQREVPPELAVVSLSVSARDRAKDAVLALLTERADVLRAALDGYGAAIERHETSDLQVFPEFQQDGERPVAYVGRVHTTVTVADFTVLGEMLPRLAGLDGVGLNGPYWQLRPGSRAGSDVRRAAIADALDRAREYAAAVGSRIDGLVEISDEGVAGIMPAARGMLASAAEGQGHAPVLQLDPRRQTVHASVLVRVTITEPDLSE